MPIEGDHDEKEKLARVVEARRRLMERFRAAHSASPSMADGAPQGEGPPNRHGMPLVPAGQVKTEKWPVLDLGIRPKVTTREQWQLVVDGAVARPITLDFQALTALEVIDDVSDFHCVTTWSKLDIPWRGVRVSTLLALAEPVPEATHLMCHGSDGYSTNVSLVEATKDDVLVTWQAHGQPLPIEHGGPVRMITPQLYAWKGSKWLSRLEVMVGDKAGFWEERGYSMTAYPWREDRYR
jgi:DMSO/TMAO reductase YedYZ molybdopterin-dependent catalytic subunit